MKGFIRYFVYFFIPSLLLVLCFLAISIWQRGSFDIFTKTLIITALVFSVFLAVAFSLVIFFKIAVVKTGSFAVSSEKGRKRALDAIEKLLLDGFAVEKTALKSDEHFSGEIFFMRGLGERISIKNESRTITVSAPKKVMSAIEALMSEIQWEI